MDAIQKTICTSCGAPNLIKEGEQEYFCSHCGGKNYLVRQDEERTSIQSPDETRQPKTMETEALSSNSELNAGIEACQRTTGADVPQDARPYEWKTSVGWSVFGMVCGYVFWQVVATIIVLLITLAYSETGREFDQNAIAAMAVSYFSIFFLPLSAYISWLDGAVRQQRRIKNSAVSFFNCFFGSILFGPYWNSCLTKKRRLWGSFAGLAVLNIVIAILAVSCYSAYLAEIQDQNSEAQQQTTQQSASSVSPSGKHKKHKKQAANANAANNTMSATSAQFINDINKYNLAPANNTAPTNIVQHYDPNARRATSLETSLKTLYDAGEDLANTKIFGKSSGEAWEGLKNQFTGKEDFNPLEVGHNLASFGATLLPSMVGGLAQDPAKIAMAGGGADIANMNTAKNTISNEALTADQRQAYGVEIAVTLIIVYILFLAISSYRKHFYRDSNHQQSRPKE